MKDRIRKLRLAAGLTQEQLGERVGVLKAAVSKWERGQTKPDAETLPRLARALGANVTDLYDEPRAAAAVPPQAPHVPDADLTSTVDVPTFAQMPRDVPVFGTVIGGLDGEFVLNGEIVDYVRRPPGIATNRQVFAVYVTGDSMEPRHRPGDLVYINPARHPRPGDDVIIELFGDEEHANGAAFIKTFVRRDTQTVFCSQLNPAGPVTYPLAMVKRMMRIMTLAELLGV